MPNIFPTSYTDKNTPVWWDKMMWYDSVANTNNNITVQWVADFTVANKSTTDLSEWTNLYFTNTRADARVSANTRVINATQNTDTDLSTNAYFLDEPNLTSNSATKVPSQQSVKNYVDIQAFMTEFGNWSDWDVTITTNVTLTRDMMYRNLTITSPWVLDTNWYKVYVKNTFSWNWTINRDWNAWANWSWFWAASVIYWWAWWAALNQWTLNAEVWWAAWWATSVGWAWTSANPSYTTFNWAAWWVGWGRYWSWAWWAGWTATRWPLYATYYNLAAILSWLNPASAATPATQYIASAWAWWGWWDYTPDAWAGWGWGWGNGWMIWIAAQIFNFTWTISALWWNGWWSLWDWGWGWGWNWWLLYLIWRTFTATWTHTLTWWTWWVVSGISWYPAPWNWANWANWITIQITI